MCKILKVMMLSAVIFTIFQVPTVNAAMDLGDKCNILCKEKGMYFDPYGESWCDATGYCDCACVK
jgi:hypothetical protein